MATGGINRSEEQRILSLHVMLIVLFAALLHAAWKRVHQVRGQQACRDHPSGDRCRGNRRCGPAFCAGAGTSQLAIPGGVRRHSLRLLQPVSLAYRTGELSFAYPMMRGSAPLFTAVLTFFVVGEPIGGGGWSGILLLCAGILWLARDGWRSATARSTRWPLHCSTPLSLLRTRSWTDSGVRASQHAWSYVLWLFFLNMFLSSRSVGKQCQGDPLYAGPRVA